MRYAVLAGVLFSVVATAAYGISTPTPSWTPRPTTPSPTPSCAPGQFCTCGRFVAPPIAQQAAIHAAADIRFATAADVTARRNDLIQSVWKGFGIPTNTPVVTLNVPTSDPPLAAYVGVLPHVATINRYDVDVPTASSRFHSVLYHWISNATAPGCCPVENPSCTVCPGTGKLIVLSDGHEDFWPGSINNFQNVLLTQGFDILGQWMPTYGPNTAPAGIGHDDHAALHWAPYITSDFAPIRAYLDPAIISLNYVLANYSYTTVAALGWSGGGWMTLALAAFDTRVQLSYPVAANAGPYWMNVIGDHDAVTNALCNGMGIDFENGNNGTPNGIDSLAYNQELYVLASAPQPRRQIHIINFGDGAVMSGVGYKSFSLIEQIKAAAVGGDWKLWIDLSSFSHQLSTQAQDLILKDIAGVRYADQEDYGFWQSGLWTNVPDGSPVSFQYSSASIGSGVGANSVSWSIPPPGSAPLPSGTYRVSVTYPPMSMPPPNGNTTSVVFQLFDGAAFIGQGIVNEQLTPGDINDLGALWIDLSASAPVSSGTLTVKLTDASGSGNVLADAVRVQLIGGAATPTPQPTVPPGSTATAVPTRTNTPLPTNTAVPTSTQTPAPTSTGTLPPTPTHTPTPPLSGNVTGLIGGDMIGGQINGPVPPSDLHAQLLGPMP